MSTDDYPDYAQAVAQSVADARNDFGVLVCTTGIGMSIAANKVPGVRAALVADEATAALARQHNNANVLCLAGKTRRRRRPARSWMPSSARQFEGGRHERRVQQDGDPASACWT